MKKKRRTRGRRTRGRREITFREMRQKTKGNSAQMSQRKAREHVD